MALVPQIVDAVAVPVVAAGGIADGRGLVASLGATGILLGTRFVATRESMAPEFWKKSLLEREGRHHADRRLLGLWLRTLRNTYTDEYRASGAPVLPPLLQTRAAQDVVEEARRRADGQYFPMLAGQGVGLVRPARRRRGGREHRPRGTRGPGRSPARASRVRRLDQLFPCPRRVRGERVHPRARDPAGRLLAPYGRLALHVDQRHRRGAGRDLHRQLPGLVADRGASRRRWDSSWSRAGWRASPCCRSPRPIWWSWFRGLPVAVRILALTAVLFFVPSAVLGMISPSS